METVSKAVSQKRMSDERIAEQLKVLKKLSMSDQYLRL
jgi:hypothetical protein